jgi:uncharacterized membrane protein HdeD (DUF308 family)
MILVGAILLISPDSATALVFRITGWILIGGGAFTAIQAANHPQSSRPAHWLGAALCIIGGIWLLKNPLILSTLPGRFVGIFLVIQGAYDLRSSARSRVTGALTAIAGAVLFLLPRTLTNTVLSLCGIALIVIGVLNLVSRLKNTRRLEDGSKPTIIDADE